MISCRAVKWLSLSVQMAANAAVGLLLARILAHSLGVSARKDAFDAAYALPFIIVALVGLGWIHSVIISHLSRLQGTDACQQLFTKLLWTTTALSAICALACYVLPHFMADLLVPGLSQSAKSECAHFIRLLSPAIIAISISTVLSAALVAYELPVALESAHTLIRGGAIIGITMISDDLSVVCVSLVVSGYVAVLAYAVIVCVWTPLRLHDGGKHLAAVEVLRPILAQSAGFFLAGLTAQALQVGTSRVATTISDGSLAAFGYASTISGFMVSLIGKPFYQAYSATIARAESRCTTRRILGIGMMISVTASVVLMFVVDHVVAILLEGGAFSLNETTKTSTMCRILVLSVPAQVALWICLPESVKMANGMISPILYAAQNTATMLMMPILAIMFGELGICWAYTIAISVHAAVVSWMCCRARAL